MKRKNPPAYVKCYICGKQFDRANNKFVQKQLGETGTRFRYAHPECEPDKEALSPNDRCAICGRAGNERTIPWLPNTTLMAHPTCITKDNPSEYDLLQRYCCSLFGYNSLERSPVLKEIATYHDQYNYSYSAIRKTLMWWYEIEKNDIQKANGHIAIVPYVIKKAKDYWDTVQKAQEVNKDVEIKPTTNITVNIREQKRQRFHSIDLSFLEEEEDAE